MTLFDGLCLALGVSGTTAAVVAVTFLVRAQAAILSERVSLALQLAVKDQALERAQDAARKERQGILAETSERLATELARMMADRQSWAQERADLVARASAKSVDEYAQMKLVHDTSPSVPSVLRNPSPQAPDQSPWLSDPRWQGYAVSHPDQDGIVWVTSDDEVIAKISVSEYSQGGSGRVNTG
jgi:hypothetical protein